MRELLLSNPQIAPLKTGQPVWEMAFLYPVQGDWTEREYLALENGRLLVEFDNGHLEFGAMPTREHQRVVLFLYRMLWQFLNVGGIGGELFVAPLPVKLWGKKYREPDVVYLSAERVRRTDEQYPEGADLVMEVVSGAVSDRYRDLIEKREEYARAGIPEYWIVDPEMKRVTVLTLAGDSYAVHGEFGQGEEAASVLLAGFGVGVTAVFAAAALK